MTSEEPDNQEEPIQAGDLLVVTPSVKIPLSEFQFSYSRSGGPGGQNVNKLETKAHLRWAVQQTGSLSDEQKARFLTKYKTRITTEGDLVIDSQRYRKQKANADDCLQKLREMVASILTPPRPRKKTKPTRGSKERRLQSKRERSQRKERRSKVDY